jgi:hypothetical protein
MPQVQRRMQKLYPDEKAHYEPIYNIQEEIDEDLLNEKGLLNTIKVPTNLSNLTKRLPKSNYNIRAVNTYQPSKRNHLDLLSNEMTSNTYNGISTRISHNMPTDQSIDTLPPVVQSMISSVKNIHDNKDTGSINRGLSRATLELSGKNNAPGTNLS